MIDQCASPPRLLDLLVSRRIPLMRMAYRTGTHHVQIHTDRILDEMLVGFHSRCMVAILLKGALASLSVVVLLPGSSCNELHGPRDNLTLTAVNNQKMDVVGRDHVVQDAQALTLFCLE